MAPELRSASSSSLPSSSRRYRFRQLYSQPNLHQDWGEEQDERKVTWTELFFDLFYVAATTNLTKMVEHQPDGSGVGKFFLYYGLFFSVWLSFTIFQTRIRLEGYLFDIIGMLFHLSVLGMVIFCRDIEWYKRFAICYALARVFLGVMYAFAGYFIPRARLSCLVNLVVYTVVVALALVAAFLNNQTAFIAIFIAIIAIEVVGPLAPLWLPQARLPVHVDHVAERLGLIMIIFLGETIVGLGIGPLANTARQYLGIAFVALVIWNLHLTYFHSQPEADDHAMRISRYRGLGFTYLHWLLGAMFVLTGAGMVLILETYTSTDGASHRRRLLSAAAAPAEATGAAPGEQAAAAHEGGLEVVSSTVAWLTCCCYAGSLHVCAAIRACHYMTFRGKDVHGIYQLSRRIGVIRHMQTWWVLVWLFPVPCYFFPFAASSLTATGLLALLACHGLVQNTLETGITHAINAHPKWQEFLTTPEAQSAHMRRHHSHGGMDNLTSQSAPADQRSGPHDIDGAPHAGQEPHSLYERHSAAAGGDVEVGAAGAGGGTYKHVI